MISLSAQPGPGTTGQIPQDQVSRHAGGRLTAEGARQMEAALRATPDDRASHLAVLGYYFWHHDAGWQDNAARHLLWFIAHDPGCPALPIAGSIRLDNFLEQSLIRAWADAVTKNPDSVAALKNAATFVSMRKPAFIAGVWKRIIALEPECSSCRNELGAACAWMLYGVRGSDEHGIPVFSFDADLTDEAVARQTLDASEDGRVLVTAGWALNGYASAYERQTGRSPGALLEYGSRLCERGYALDPALPRPGGGANIAAPAPPASPSLARPATVAAPPDAMPVVKRVAPVYPPLARQAHLSGKVRLEVVVGTDGGVISTRLIEGHPLLVDAARVS